MAPSYFFNITTIFYHVTEKEKSSILCIFFWLWKGRLLRSISLKRGRWKRSASRRWESFVIFSTPFTHLTWKDPRNLGRISKLPTLKAPPSQEGKELFFPGFPFRNWTRSGSTQELPTNELNFSQFPRFCGLSTNLRATFLVLPAWSAFSRSSDRQRSKLTRTTSMYVQYNCANHFHHKVFLILKKCVRLSQGWPQAKPLFGNRSLSPYCHIL